MKLLRSLIFVGIFGYIVYNSVDDTARAKIDNGFEEQMITLKELQQNAYLVAWSFFGAYDEEVADKRTLLEEEIAERRRKLQERRDETERDPAYVKKANKYDKYLAK